MSMALLPVKKGVCESCAVDHLPSDPHDQTSLYYQYWFYGQHGRWPTWADAMAHCDDETKAAWGHVLREHGMWSEP